MKILRKILVCCIALVMSVISVAHVIAADDISVVLNGEKVTFNDAKPIIYEDRTLIPVRAVFEQAGWKVLWDQDSKTAKIGNDEKIVSITIDYVFMKVYDINTNKEDMIFLDVAAVINNDRTMVPLRAVCEAMGADVQWNDATKTVYITN